MNEKQYHHGDLRTAMIEKGFEAINEEGLKAFSLQGSGSLRREPCRALQPFFQQRPAACGHA